MLGDLFADVLGAYERALHDQRPTLSVREIGTVIAIDGSIVVARGLPEATNEEIVRFESGAIGLVLGLEPGRVSIAVFDSGHEIHAGTVVSRTGRVLDSPVGAALLGRVVDSLGRPLDDLGPIVTSERWAVERPAPSIMRRAPIKRPLHTGVTVVDSMIPIGRGQRELLLGDRQTGKTAMAVDAILHQRGSNVRCVYCAIGQQTASVARIVEKLRAHGALDYTLVVAAESGHPPAMRFAAPYAAMTMAEWFMERGEDVLIVFDDLTQHAQAYRELALLMRRPPGREAYPGDIFFVHSRLLERATQLLAEFGGGSVTAIPIVETEAQDIAGYIPTNIISITDGQILLSPTLFQKGFLPAVDVGASVSRVGGKAQLPTYRAISGKLKLAHAQYEELEQFARFGTRMDAQTKAALQHGRLVREILKQRQGDTLAPAAQIAALLGATERLFDAVPFEQVASITGKIRSMVLPKHREWVERVHRGERLEDADHDPLRATIASVFGTNVVDEVLDTPAFSTAGGGE